MFLFVHIAFSWIIAHSLLENKKDRILVVIAAMIVDIDALSIIGGWDLYLAYHRALSHSIFFGIFLFLIVFLLSKNRKLTSISAIIVLPGHIALDLISSNIPIRMFYPLSDYGISTAAIISDIRIYGVINVVGFLLSITLLFLIAYKKEIAPLELVSKRFNKRIVGLLIYPFKYKCDICGERTIISCK